MSKHSPANFNSLHDQRAGNKSNAAQSVAISPSGAPGSTGDPLSPSPSNLTKEEEEQRAAKMSKIWGEGRLSDDTEAHLDRETQTVWGEGVWDAGLSRPVPGRKGATSANLSWDRFGSGSGSNGLGWSGSERVGGEAVSDPVEINGLVGHPLPCEFGPIGKQTKRKQDTKTDENGTTKTKTATNGTTLVGNPKENGKVKKNRASGNGSHSHDKTSDTGQGRRPSHSTRHRSSSTELWVSAETETWPYEEPSENVFHEEKREESVEKRSAGSLAPTSPSLPSHTHRNKSHLSDGSKSPNPSPCEQSGSFADDTSFEDPAIINMVRQSPLPLEGGAHLQDPSWGVDLEPENQEPLFAPPSSETSPEQQKTRPLPSSKRLSLLLSPPSRQPAPANPHLITHTTDTRFNGVTAPTDAYFSGGATSLSRREDTAHSSTNTTTVQCSTPTLIPDDEEEEGELVVEGGRDYFPSAFETDRPSLAPGLCLNESGEVPNNAVIITSSFDAGVVPSSLPVNCVSTSPAESGNCVSLWPSGEKSGKEGEGLVPLEGSPHSSVQEASGESVSYCIGSSSGAAEERHAEEFSPSTKEVPNAQSDLAFLKECFPDLSRPFLKKLLQQSDGNVEEAVSTALVSSVVSPTQPPVGAGEMFNWSPLTVDPFYFGGGLNYWGLGSAFNDGSSAASMTSESEMEGGGGGEEVWASDGDDECMDDGEIARLIQEELDLEASSEEPSLETLWKFAAGETERRGTEEEDDENLVLRLSRSLASQLQQMFGSVDKHLPVEGELRDEDLKVLLSERAARQIWQKWIDTLEAKKVEILLNQDSAASRAKSVPATLVASPDSRPPERSSTEPERLTSIMDEQSAQQTSAKQVRRVVMAACSKNMARTMRLRQLYRQFRTLSKDTIEYVLFKNSFNFSSAAAELEREKACEEGVDGNAASQSGLTSFAGTAAKTTTGAVGPSDKPRAALLQLPSRSPSRRRRRPANKTKQPTRNKEGLEPQAILKIFHCIKHSSFETESLLI
ncbi:hypothetical protein GBAR_LOCUS6697 [Geodia barretti]|uniref:CUE domain-containing protein n=1 Tax=Geodia barretti TaxID=519541 RepID=A0AA35W7F8_GEOBA|nr:hypothetical protein GBAR_LOCUS6697 [Geodia barretti]